MNGSGDADVVVVIPAYQAASVISASLESVVAQSVAPREVVVVDDGSSDGTADVARRFSSVLPLTVVTQSNAGPAAARRHALAMSRGSVVALLDADDVWLPDHLGTLMATFRRTGGIVTADAYPWRPGRSPSRETRRSQFPIPSPARQRVEILRRNFVFVGSLFSRAAYEAAGGFRDGFTGAEDWDLWIRMLRCGTAVTGAPGAPTMLYRLVAGSLTRRPAIYDRYIAVLDAALPGCVTDEERRVVTARTEWLRARRALAISYQAAAEGRLGSARRAAIGAFPRFPRMAAQAVGLMVTPSVTFRLADRIRARVVR